MSRKRSGKSRPTAEYFGLHRAMHGALVMRCASDRLAGGGSRRYLGMVDNSSCKDLCDIFGDNEKKTKTARGQPLNLKKGKETMVGEKWKGGEADRTQIALYLHALADGQDAAVSSVPRSTTPISVVPNTLRLLEHAQELFPHDARFMGGNNDVSWGNCRHFFARHSPVETASDLFLPLLATILPLFPHRLALTPPASASSSSSTESGVSLSQMNHGPHDAGLLQLLDQVDSLRQRAAEAAAPSDWEECSRAFYEESNSQGYSFHNEVYVPPSPPTSFPSPDVNHEPVVKLEFLRSPAHANSYLPDTPPAELADSLTIRPWDAPPVWPPSLPSPISPPDALPATSKPHATLIAKPAAPPKPPAAAKSRKKTIGETQMVCGNCGTLSGRFLLHGDPTTLATAYDTAYTCSACELAASFNIAASFVVSVPHPELERDAPVKRKRKNGRPSGPGSIACNSCAVVLGVGGVRLVDTGAAGESGGKLIWIDPEFDVEAMCASCFEHFAFCTEPGRRTCVLAHERIGYASYEYEVFETPTETFEAVSPKHDPAILLSLLKSLWIDTYLNGRASPLVMRQLDLFPYPLLEQRAEASWEETKAVMTERGPGTNRRFLCLVWAVTDAAKTKKHRKEKERIPWSGGADSSAPDVPERRAALSGIGNCEYNPSRGTLHMSASLGKNHVALFTSITVCIERILAEPRAPDQPPLQYVWTCQRRMVPTEPADPPAAQESSSTSSSSSPPPTSENSPSRSTKVGFGFRLLQDFLDNVENPPPAEYFDRREYYPEHLCSLLEVRVVETQAFLDFVKKAQVDI
ncbi:hypothetical protein BDK51DRAFT_38276 [Blyttiomyces helicus]|uniref:Uncharacterized protein n=1 Tax=Blyttiomyces helicus TaxID=388810 RepID=A0A4P9W4W1_9FUNG|nr:hypothetical protein BDK51DRAFT_38276 [Blyttiomyces helicus]|eukprot:RKO87399.1 hypothetical protein BDK51DRAFT_38276 [Blyttiomyces helicus]